MTKEQYLNQRKQLLNEAKGFLDAGDIEKFNAKKKEVEDLDAKYEAAATAQANLAALEGACVVPMSMQNLAAAGQPAASASTEDRFDSTEYKTAFMNYACRREPMPEKFRNEAGNTTTGDVGAVIPTSWLKEIVRELKERGVIFQQLRRLNVQGGIEIPILDLMPTASWVGDEASEDQKLAAENTISFKYHGLECKISQSILVSVVTLDAFQELFVELATEAVIAAVELGVFKGSGTKQMLGVCNDPRVTNVVEMTADDVSKWAQWKKKFFTKIKKRYKGGKLYMAQGTFEAYVDGMVDQNGQPVARTNYGISGDPTYRFGGKDVETVEEDILSDFETAATGEVFAVYMNMKDYVFNSNMVMSVVQWTDHDTNKKKTKVMLICDGKAADTNGIILLKKKA